MQSFDFDLPLSVFTKIFIYYSFYTLRRKVKTLFNTSERKSAPFFKLVNCGNILALAQTFGSKKKVYQYFNLLADRAETIENVANITKRAIKKIT